MQSDALDPAQFRRITARNTILPLTLAVLLSAVFIAMIMHLVSVGQWVNHSNRVMAVANNLQKLTIDGETGLRGYVITEKPNFLEPYNRANAIYDAEIAKLRALVTDNAQQVERVDHIRSLHESWIKYAETLVTSKLSIEQRADIVQSEKGKSMMDSIRQQFIDFINEEQTLRDQRTTETEDSVKQALALIVIGSLLVGAFIALYSRRQLNAMSAIYTGILNKQAAQNEALDRTSRIRSAQVELTERLVGDIEIPVVTSETLALVCRKLDAKVGTLYLLEGGDRLRLAASFGLSEEELKARDNIPLGATLVGQAARDQKPFTLDPAPADHIRISTSLGDSVPKALMVIPATNNRVTKAVLEVALTRSTTPQDLELMQTLSETIGVAITSAQYRSRLKDLLGESQRQAEELQVQQEELKVSNEELEEQAEALKESQARLESQQVELEQTNLQVTEQTRALERQNDELARASDDLKKQSNELARASQYKSQFLANMSHELRTPLNSTLILTQLLIENKAGKLGQEEIDYAKTILSASNDLLALINDILDLAKVESGTIELHPEESGIREIIHGLERSFGAMAKDKGIAFNAAIAESAADSLMIDRQRLNQILKNLISNAIKFTQKGEVKITVSPASATSTRFEIFDTGIGIPEAKQKIIFEAFKQADGTTSRQFGGTGLGLSISRELSDLLGGDIQVKSTPSIGSTFTLIVPNDGREGQPGKKSKLSMTRDVVAAPMLPSIDERAPAPPKRRGTPRGLGFQDDRDNIKDVKRLLMIVEDDAAFAKVLFNLCHEQKFSVIATPSAEEAVDLAVEYAPQAIILDMHLPDHSGLFVLDRLKDNPATRHIPVHVISAQDHSTAALQMGAIGYLMKPADSSKLVDVIQGLEAKLAQNFKKVLVVEDNAIQREAMKKLISFPGVEVVSAENGDGALKMLSESSFDCLVLDLTLPDMSGYDVLERMSAQEKVSCPPVIIYTAKSLSREEEQKLQKYSHSIILKGAKSPERLLSEVSLFLHQVESKMPPERQKVLQELRDREKTLEGRRILLVDDDVRNIFALNSALQPRGAHTEIARNGKEALAKLDSNPEIDLVLMDLMMPEMDGYEAMRLIRKNPIFQKLPIIAVTAKAMSDDQEKCIEAGASDYLAKPIDLSKLLSLIKIWLRTPGGIA